MGLCRMGPPEALVLRLGRAFDVPYFVETGTLRGATAAWASQHFRRVWTIEASARLHVEAQQRHASRRNVEFVLGDSRRALPRVLGELDGPAIFWLDAHWSGRATHGTDDQCPLIEEIAEIDASPHPAYLLIDDARLFLAPPPASHRVDQWPNIAQVLAALVRGAARYVVVTEDVIVAVPPEARAAVIAHCQEVQARERARPTSDLRRGFGLIAGDLLRRVPGGGRILEALRVR
jgi:hypothetical protein